MKYLTTIILSLISLQTACFGQQALNKDTSLHCLTTKQLNYFLSMPFQIQDLKESVVNKDFIINQFNVASVNFKKSLESKDKELIDTNEKLDLYQDKFDVEHDKLDRAEKIIKKKNFIIYFGLGLFIPLTGYLGAKSLINK